MSKVFLILGATGDLAQRKIYPAIYSLSARTELDDDLIILGTGRRNWNDREFSEFVGESVEKFYWDKFNPHAMSNLSEKLRFQELDFSQSELFVDLIKKIDELEVDQDADELFIYFAISPELFPEVTKRFESSGFIDKFKKQIRILVEKPFGTDFESATELNQLLHRLVPENQIFRIDHVLNQDTLQDLVNFRKYNRVFDHLFSNEYVEHIQISYFEDIGVGDRVEFYEKTGALRDMVQSHILEIISLLLLDSRTLATTKNFMKSRAEVISSLDFSGEKDLVLGQYSEYTSLPGVAVDSQVETFVALKIESNLDNWRGVPIFIRTGKKLKRKYVDVVLTFKNFDTNIEAGNKLIFRLFPDSGISIDISKPKGLVGLGNEAEELELFHPAYCYKNSSYPRAYENMINRILSGNFELFVSKEEIEASWELIDKIRSIYGDLSLEIYRENGIGPISTTKLIEQYDYSWFDDNFSDFCRI